MLKAPIKLYSVPACEVCCHFLNRSDVCIFKLACAKVAQYSTLSTAHQFNEFFLKLLHFGYRYFVHKASRGRSDDSYLLLNRHWRVLVLFQDLGIPATAFDGQLSRRIQVRPEFCESFKLAELSLVELQGTGYFFHRLDLGRT